MKNWVRAIMLFVILIGGNYSIAAQSDSTNKHKSFGYGVSNLLELYDFSNYHPGIYIEFGQVSPIENWDYNIKLIGNYQFTNQNNIRNHSFIPFRLTFGLERKVQLEKVFLSFNANLFYSMSLRKTSISGFQGDDYGVGVSPGVNINFPLREDLILSGGLEYGVGFFRDFVSVGTVTRQTMVLNYAAIRNFSFGIRHYF